MAKLSDLASPSATRAVLQAHGLATKKSLGQNFLINDDILAKIIALADVGDRDVILEVGPGIGTLSMALLRSAHEVVAIERDPDLPEVLADTLVAWDGSFHLIEKDALDVSRADIEACATTLPHKLVANLPYAVAATVVLQYFESFDFLDSATVMVQKEVADRMAATPGKKNYGAYTVKLGMYAESAGRFLVGPGNFFPPPHVDSAVLRLNRVTRCDAAGKPLTPEEIQATCTMANAAFASRRKTILNSCKTYFSGSGPRGKERAALAPEILERAGIDPACRGETLTIDEFIALGLAYKEVLTSKDIPE